MTAVEWYAAAYGTYLLLTAASIASIFISARGRSRRVGGTTRLLCLVLIGVFAVVFQFQMTDAKSSTIAKTIHIFLIIVAVSVSWSLIAFGARREWAHFWDFSPQPFLGGVRINFKVAHDRWTSGWIRGWLLHVVGVALGAAAVFCMTYMGRPRWPVVLGLSLAGAGAGIANWGRNMRLQARREHARRVEPDEPPSGSYVLYLRMFDADERHAFVTPTRNITMDLTDMLLPGSSEEEDLANVMRPVGPMIAVGIPGEELPHAGAMRMYLPMNWKPPVGQLIRNARLIVIELGLGAGTVWEVAEALSVLPPQRLLLIIPEAMTDNEYEQVRRRVKRELRGQATSRQNAYSGLHRRRALPSRPCSKNPNGQGTGFIYFSDDWKAIYASGYYVPWLPTQDFFAITTKAITPLFDELKAYEERTGKSWG